MSYALKSDSAKRPGSNQSQGHRKEGMTTGGTDQDRVPILLTGSAFDSIISSKLQAFSTLRPQ